MVSRSEVKVIGNVCLWYHVQHIIQESFAPGQRSSLFSPVWEGGYKCFTLISCIQCGWVSHYISVIFRAQEPKAPVTYCDHALSGVCLSVVRRPLDYLHFRLLLQNRLMDFDETWYGWSTQGPLQVLLFFGQIRPGADPGRGKNRSRGSPSSGNFFFRPEGYSNKPNA